MATVAMTRRLAPIGTAANLAGVCDKTVRRMIARGDLTGYRVGKRLIRVDLDELESIIRPIPSAKVG